MHDTYAFLWSIVALLAAGVISAILYKRWTISSLPKENPQSRSNDLGGCSGESENSSSTSVSAIDSEDIDEASVRRQQLSNILHVMNAYEKEFGLTTMDDLLEQAKLYGINK